MSVSKEYSLIKRCQEGDISAFREIYEKEKIKLFNVAFRICGNREDAEDCIQETFVKVYKNIGSFKFESAFSTWIHRILVNTCLTHQNRSAEKEELFEEPKSEPKSEFHLLEALEKEISKLTDLYRSVFVLYEVEGFNHIEIGEMLNITVGTSKSRLSRAKEILRERLKDYQDYAY